MIIRFRYARPTAIYQVTRSGVRQFESVASLDAGSMEAAMFEDSTIGSHVLRHRPATIIDALLAAAIHALAWLIGVIANELRMRRDMRQLAAMDDHMLKDIGLHRCEIGACVRHGRSA
jgi:uncharacterized protein YjiS (DUF1127 family)